MIVTLAFKAFAKAIPCSTPFLATSDPSVLREYWRTFGGSPCCLTSNRNRRWRASQDEPRRPRKGMDLAFGLRLQPQLYRPAIGLYGRPHRLKSRLCKPDYSVVVLALDLDPTPLNEPAQCRFPCRDWQAIGQLPVGQAQILQDRSLAHIWRLYPD